MCHHRLNKYNIYYRKFQNLIIFVNKKLDEIHLYLILIQIIQNNCKNFKT